MHKDYEKRIASAKHLMRVVLREKDSPDVYSQHIKELLSVLLWKITVANGKKNTPYVSEGYKKLADKNKGIHEHVVPRKTLIDRLLSDPGIVDTIEQQAIACMVTHEEHERLHSVEETEFSDWKDRYRAAGVNWIKNR